MGTAYLLCPEAKVSPLYREALKNTTNAQTTLTNIFTDRPARRIINRAIKELGAISQNVPDSPLATTGLEPLHSKAEAVGSSDFTPLWSKSTGAPCSGGSRSRADEATHDRNSGDAEIVAESYLWPNVPINKSYCCQPPPSER
jgi:hypothetical protein